MCYCRVSQHERAAELFRAAGLLPLPILMAHAYTQFACPKMTNGVPSRSRHALQGTQRLQVIVHLSSADHNFEMPADGKLISAA